MAIYNVSIPVKLDAFVFNTDVCEVSPDPNKQNARIAPINQPNYTFLRFEDNVLQSDILSPIDVHNSQPSSRNSRVTDLGTGETRSNRLGVYLHWIMPRPYRSQPSAAPGTKKDKTKKRTALDNTSTPAWTFPNPPTRWLVIRKLDPNAPTTKPAGTSIPAVEAWVVESDRVSKIDDITDSTADLQVDVSPFIDSSTTASKDPAGISVDKQAEIFIGHQEPAATWVESTWKRVELRLLNSSNQLFADYQPHNSNVFSFVDRFQYGDGQHLTDAVADYYVLGWHWDPSDDPFNLSPGGTTTLGTTLGQWSMAVKDTDNCYINQWCNLTDATRAICHGAMYSVEWHSRWNTSPVSNRPAKTPGDDFSDFLANSMPVSVGTTATDALLAYVDAHHKDELANDIRQLGALLHAQDDSVAGQQAGEDEVQNYNFARLAGGTHYVLPMQDGKPLQPPTCDLKTTLRELNRAQYLWDCAERSYQEAQWDTFALWWRFVTDIDPSDGDYVQAAQALDKTRTELNTVITEQKANVAVKKAALTKQGLQPKSTASVEFSQQKDPTMFIGGTQAGWPEDFLKPLAVRLDPQILTFTGSKQAHSVGADNDPYGITCLPGVLQTTASALVAEFLANHPSATSASPPKPVSAGNDPPPPPTTYPPLYHDQGNPSVPHPADAPWRDRWESTQPWFPLFVEWEIEYFHIPYEPNWALDERTARLQSHKKFRYAIKDGIVLSSTPKDQLDARRMGGRILLLPQPTYSLSAQINQLFSSTPPTVLDQYLCATERQKLLAGISSLPFVSAPLDGFNNHLLTALQGSHLKPNARVPGGDPVPITAAYVQSDSKRVGLGPDQLSQMGIETNLTPYGSEVQIVNPYSPSNGDPSAAPVFSPFKPVAHGQFRFTKINVVDKFGQVAAALDPTPRPLSAGPPPFYPCISDYYEPQVLKNSGVANTIVAPASPNVCGLAQVPPQINQPARLNASFVQPDDAPVDGVYWRPVTEWENPIWGWLVINYVDNGIQFFMQDGTFYREVRVSARGNSGKTSRKSPSKTSAIPEASVGHKWLPFDPDSNPPTMRQLDLLIDKLYNDQDFLETFMDMITAAVGDNASVPSAYSQFMQCLVGKPLALVNMGVTLELAADPKKNQSTVNKWDSDVSVTDYSFPFKLGDHDRTYDGLVGYFQAKTKCLSAGSELDLSKLYTSNVDNPSPPFYPINNHTFSQVSAQWTAPSQFETANYPDGDPQAHFETALNAQLTANVFGCIVDPFQPLNVYSAILPVRPLTLPPWTWETALKTMTAFFHFGPLVIPDDVPKWQKEHRLIAQYTLTPPGQDQTVDLKDLSPLKLPSLRTTDWSWLQPYVDDEGKPDAFMALSLGVGDSRPRFEKGPYTVVEGYLQMKAPIQPNNSG